MAACAAQQATRRADATSAAQASGTHAGQTRNPQPLMADEIVYALHRAIVVRDSDRKGYGYPDNPVKQKDSAAHFSIVGELSDSEARESVAKRLADTDAHIEQVKMQAAVERRVVELRHEAARHHRLPRRPSYPARRRR